MLAWTLPPHSHLVLVHEYTKASAQVFLLPYPLVGPSSWHMQNSWEQKHFQLQRRLENKQLKEWCYHRVQTPDNTVSSPTSPPRFFGCEFSCIFTCFRDQILATFQKPPCNLLNTGAWEGDMMVRN